MTPRARIDVSLEAALADKWQAGREKYGPAWTGEHPLIEAHDEALDLILYARANVERGGDPLPGVIRAATGILLGLRAAVRRMEEKP